ncbi:MarR family winged helix-turn-helix transcriptional regulator [Actinomadura opuntiae]|uniref:MarR family winged helix-turn-helix transcriptional regulator n=1 Tax=Actinomadura sp. OS1-43 TaxID=604315 RepID=UPI00255A8521|nr:MarR family transcriptional regulator [Actinomadura sp. OS1-43]MDL4815611.1 MarR family transcriptional regulator [Actinomadura sp. OS1-43]
MDGGSLDELSQEDFASLLAFRTGLRRYLRWSETRVREAGLTPAQHQLLLAIKGHGTRRAPTVGELAGYLLLRHHSTVELIDRAERAGLVRRGRDPEDNRVIRVSLTPTADRVLHELTRLHLAELQSLAPILERLSAELKHLEGPQGG